MSAEQKTQPPLYKTLSKAWLICAAAVASAAVGYQIGRARPADPTTVVDTFTSICAAAIKESKQEPNEIYYAFNIKGFSGITIGTDEKEEGPYICKFDPLVSESDKSAVGGTIVIANGEMKALGLDGPS